MGLQELTITTEEVILIFFSFLFPLDVLLKKECKNTTKKRFYKPKNEMNVNSLTIFQKSMKTMSRIPIFEHKILTVK
jgi:hypothetical protein